MSPKRVLITGAGLTGAVIARTLADAGHFADVIDKRSHVAGNCHTTRDERTNVMVHTYGPHIFHTDDKEVWDFVNSFMPFKPYRHSVRTTVQGGAYSMPINLLTINQFFGKTMGPAEARAFIEARADKTISDPKTFRDQALRFVGKELYEAFFEGYTQKQWGCDPSELPASTLKRLPLRFDYNDNYYSHPYQGMPEHGYTAMVEAILCHENINVQLGAEFKHSMTKGYDHLFYSGPLDHYFDNCIGNLGYRTLDFERFEHDGDYQGCAVMNYGDRDVPYTRITEHKHFSPWEQHDASVCYRETSRECTPGDIPYYPIRLVEEKKLLVEYQSRAAKLSGVTFVGRLGTYRYLDMDTTIRAALDAGRHFVSTANQSNSPVFLSA